VGGKALKILEPELATRAISALDRFSTRAEQTFAQSRQTKIDNHIKKQLYCILLKHAGGSQPMARPATRLAAHKVTIKLLLSLM